MIYINIYISSLCFSFWNDILNHRNIFCISFFNQDLIYFLINIYSDSFQLALKYLKDTEVNINNILIITRDFNIRDNFWNPNFPHHSSYRNTFFDIIDSFQLEISKSTEFFPIRNSDNMQDLNPVLDLVFLCSLSPEFDNHHIYLDERLISDHTSIIINISIFDKYIQSKKWSLIKNSDEENYSIKELVNSIKSLDIFSIQSIKALENTVQLLATNINNT